MSSQSGRRAAQRMRNAVCQGKLNTFLRFSWAFTIKRAALSAGITNGILKLFGAVMGVWTKPGHTVVTVAVDSGMKYLSTALYSSP